MTLAMVNWLASGQPGNVASRTTQLFVSEADPWWRIANEDIGGLDDNDAISEHVAFDCYFTDAETSTNATNGRSDSEPGFGLMNCAGCTYSDQDVTCRVILDD